MSSRSFRIDRIFFVVVLMFCGTAFLGCGSGENSIVEQEPEIDREAESEAYEEMMTPGPGV